MPATAYLTTLLHGTHNGVGSPSPTAEPSGYFSAVSIAGSPIKCRCTTKVDVLMTYDDAPELHDLARRHGLQTALVPMKNTHHAEMTELLIGRDLAWARTHQDVLY